MNAGKIFWLLLWLICSLPSHAHAQNLSSHRACGRYRQYVWQDQHGLPQNASSSIVRTSDGYL